MASLIKPGSVKILTKDGEIQVSLTLDININLNTDNINLNTGNMVFGLKNGEENHSINEQKEDEKIKWEIPEFEAPMEKVDFGKKV